MQQLVFSLILCMSPWTVWGYNFDTLVPTIAEIEIGASGAKEGFGFAITQHEFPDGRKVYERFSLKLLYNISCKIITIIIASWLTCHI